MENGSKQPEGGTEFSGAKRRVPLLVDLASDLLPVLAAHVDQPLSEQIEAWRAYYQQAAPDLPPRLYGDYDNMEGGWRQVAETHVFLKFPQLLPKMNEALANLREVVAGLDFQTHREFECLTPPVIVAYVGLGNGAGWATTWEETPAVLVGLENVADLGWASPTSLKGLLAHEIGHLYMRQLREGLAALPGDGFTTLFDEGFAQYCEHVMLGEDTWHCASQDGWLEWCAAHERELAERFVAAADHPDERRKFFGSWFDVCGWRQTGYYLGCRFIQSQCRNHALADVARWPAETFRRTAENFLYGLSNAADDASR